MTEETIITEEINEELNETETEAELPPRKRIMRKRIGKKRPLLESRVAAPERKEIDSVLSNLYGNEVGNIQEIKIKKSDGFMKSSAFIGLGAVFAFVLWAGFFILPAKGNDQSQIALAINGPTEVSLGATTTYSISYANNSGKALKEVVLNTYFPEGFIFLSGSPSPNNPGHNEWKLDSVAPYQKGMITVTGLNFGSLKDQKSWRVFFNYQPENFNSELQKIVGLTTTIAFSPAKLTISGPDQIAVGSEAKYAFVLQKTDWTRPLTIIPEIPTNFIITSSTPALNKNKQWLVPSSSSSAPVIFTLNGKYTGNNSSASPVKGKAVFVLNNQNYELAAAQLTSAILKSDVTVDLAMNGAISDFNSQPGEILNISILVKNSSKNEIRNAVAKVALTAPAKGKLSLLNWPEIEDKYDGDILGEQIDSTTRRGTISWNSTQIPALARLKPGDEVTINLKLPIRDGKTFDFSAIKNNHTISAGAEVSFKDAEKLTQNVTTKPMNITINSDLAFSGSEQHNGLKHMVSWVLNNSFHPLKNIQITATTYGDLTFDLIDKSAGELVYNKNENKLAWNIPEMLEETDVLNSSFSLTLSKSNPTQTLLLSKATLVAEDVVTGKTINLSLDPVELGR